MTTAQVVVFLAVLIFTVNAAERAAPKVPLKATDIPILNHPPSQFHVNAQQQNCTLRPVDLTFVVDESGSIGIENFKIVLNFLGTLTWSMVIGSALDRSQVAMVKFASSATLSFKLNTYSTNDQVYNAIIGSSYNGGGTDIASGMNLATNQVYIPASGDRPNVDNVMIVVTDGHDSSDVVGAQRAAAGKNITVFVIGVGSDVDKDQLLKIVGGNSAKVFNVTTFPGLESILNDVCYIINNSTTTTPSSPSPTGNANQCQHGGTMYCHCPFGFTGRYCETVIDSCNNTHIYSHNGDVSLPFCGPYGTCHFDPNSGSHCVCDYGWTGPMCNQPIPDEVSISTRCGFYFASEHPNPNCTASHRCLPDELNCAFSQTGCTYPSLGWCLPEKTVISMLASHPRFF